MISIANDIDALFSGSQSVHHSYKITVQNFKLQATNIAEDWEWD